MDYFLGFYLPYLHDSSSDPLLWQLPPPCHCTVSLFSDNIWKVHVIIYQAKENAMWCLWASPRAPPGTMQCIFTGALVQQSGLLTANSLLASSCTACSFPACKPYGSLTPIRTGGKERPADQRAKTALNTAAGGKHSEVALPETKKKTKLQKPAFLMKLLTWVVLIYLVFSSL